MKRLFYVAGFAVALGFPAAGEGKGLIRSVWSCFVPCEVKGGGSDAIAYLQVAYCSTTTLSLRMLEGLDPLCRAKTGRADAVAARASAADVATCVSSSNPCPTEGLTFSGFSCSYVCPSEDRVIRKFTACARTGDEAWTNVTHFCKDATPPDGSFFPTSHTCTAEGQTPCE